MYGRGHVSDAFVYSCPPMLRSFGLGRGHRTALLPSMLNQVVDFGN
jgi:hypothetical protein